ncbi:MAG: hypothetical protein M3N23_06295 [Pseudomonadota bacterium]|nr:hypothetical protein [Pseudomonadota bacterium]
MISNRNLAVALGLAGWALTFVVAKSRKQSHHLEKKLHKKEVTTWEGEGGNLPPAVTHTPNPGMH